MSTCPPNPHLRPYKLITTTDPTRTFGQGRKQHYRTLLDAAHAFVECQAPYRALLYDDGCEARELNAEEESLLAAVCDKLGYEVRDL